MLQSYTRLLYDGKSPLAVTIFTLFLLINLKWRSISVDLGSVEYSFNAINSQVNYNLVGLTYGLNIF